MAASNIKIIKNIQKEGPYYIGGYSFGGMVTFEVARQLEENKDELNMLLLIEAANPELLQTMTFSDEKAKREFEQKIDRNEFLAQKYKPEKVNTRLSLIKADLALSELTEESRAHFHNTKYGWDKYCFDIVEYTITGEHSSIFETENINHLGSLIKNLLEER